MRLFAMDLDGTLVNREGKVHPRDVAAIRAAEQRGVKVTIATGRLLGGTRPVAEALGLTSPLVCADGGVTSCGQAREVLARAPIAMEDAVTVVHAFRERGLAQFAFDHEGIVSCERGREHHGYVSAWSPSGRAHHDVLDAALGWDESPPLMLVGIGEPESVGAIATELGAAHEGLEALSFTVSWTGKRVVRFIRRGISKASGLEALAQRLGVPREGVAVIGDFYNDLPMFEWAPRSFAMPHAPADVKSRATDALEEGSWERGAIADALERWLGDSG